MKIQCDVCNRDGASVFCSADEAALCDACDRCVHHANKLAGKHERFSLLPCCKDSPRCDICQERCGFLFCQEDRAILCRECDHSIHTANEHTRKHTRFLLAGVKLSSTSTIYSSSTTTTSSSNEGSDAVAPCTKNNAKLARKEKPTSVSLQVIDPPPPMVGTATTSSKVDVPQATEGSSTSSISKYLIEMLPGWQVDEFLDSSPAPLGFNKIDDISPFWDVDHERNLIFPPEDLALWVPQVGQIQPPPPPHHTSNHFNLQNGFKESKEAMNLKGSKRWTEDVFTVPQISPPSVKRSRSFR